jgi:flagellar motor switch protein FliG
MFTFDDLSRVDARAMRELLREVPTDRLTTALKGASPEILNAVFAGLSARAAELIKDDLELLGKVRRADVDAARKEVVEAALRLEGEGKVDLGREVE